MKSMMGKCRENVQVDNLKKMFEIDFGGAAIKYNSLENNR